MKPANISNPAWNKHLLPNLIYLSKQKVLSVTASELWRSFDMTNYYNNEKYADPTAYTALKNIEREEKRKKKNRKNRKKRGVKNK